MELIDLAGFSKPITKLLDVFQAGQELELE